MEQCQMTSVFSFFAPIPDLHPDRQCGLTRCDSEIRLGGQVALVSARFQQSSAFCGGESVCEAKGSLVLIGCFPVCPEAGCPPRCLRGVTENRGRDPSLFGV